MMKHLALATGTLLVVLAFTAPAAVAAGEDNNNSAAMREASKHFQRGVTLYSEADYHAALVEFQRAYVLAPNQVVLYNIGETQYQLRDYASALSTFERYLADAGPTDPHRSQIESNVKVLRSRVGQVTVVTNPPGAEVSVDDRVIGKTPLDKPIVVGVGHVKITAATPGRPPITRYVDVAAEDSVSVTLEVSPPVVIKAPPPPPLPHVDEVRPSLDRGSSWRTVGWVATGVLAAGAIGFGVLAYRESSDLKAARNRFPAMPSTLNDKATITRNLSLVADSLATAALVVGGLTLYSGWNAHKSDTETRVMVGFGSMYLERAF